MQSGARTDTTATSEKLVHDQTRDRTVSEVVDAALKEWQRGGSVMGGLAAGAGATGSYGPFSAAVGGMSSIGGAYTTSSGNRDLRASTSQRVNDSVHQASALFRDQTTTVVVQTEASERQGFDPGGHGIGVAHPRELHQAADQAARLLLVDGVEPLGLAGERRAAVDHS